MEMEKLIKDEHQNISRKTKIIINSTGNTKRHFRVSHKMKMNLLKFMATPRSYNHPKKVDGWVEVPSHKFNLFDKKKPFRLEICSSEKILKL